MLTVASHVSGTAIAVIIVDQLHAIQGAGIGAGITQALIDIALTACAHETRWTRALEATDTINAAAIVVTRSGHTIIMVQLTDDAQCAGRAAAAEVLHKIMAGAAILAGIRCTIINVQLTVLSLEALTTLALIGTHQIPAGASILTRLRGTLIDILLAVAARISLAAIADMAIEMILAGSIVAQLLHGQPLALRCILAADRLDIAQLSCPAGGAFTIELMLQLATTGSILAGGLSTPVHIVGALFASESTGAMAGVLIPLLMASAAIQTRCRIAFI